MGLRASGGNWLLLLFAALSTLAVAQHAEAPWPERLLGELESYPHAQLIDSQRREVLDHEIGLGMLKKVRGTWGFRKSERHSGQLLSHTWQVIDGFAAQEVLETLSAEVAEQADSMLLFACEARACGASAQWANRVFGQPILYGRAEMQLYRVYQLDMEGREFRMLLYSGARSSDRQYLHAELLEISK